MNKRLTAIAMLMCILIVFAAGCSSDDTAEVSATAAAEATEVPTVTQEPSAQATEVPMVTAEPSGSDNSELTDAVSATDSPEMTEAKNYVGQSVDELYSAMGEPNSSEYTESCLVADGQDGLLYYDGFTVSTVIYADGTEMILAVY